MVYGARCEDWCWSVSGPPGVSGRAVSSDTGIRANGSWARQGQGGTPDRGHRKRVCLPHTRRRRPGRAVACRTRGGGREAIGQIPQGCRPGRSKGGVDDDAVLRGRTSYFFRRGWAAEGAERDLSCQPSAWGLKALGSYFRTPTNCEHRPGREGRKAGRARIVPADWLTVNLGNTGQRCCKLKKR